MGGRVAMEVVRIAPHRVAGLALLDTGYLAKADGEEGDEEVRKRMALLHIAQTQGVATKHSSSLAHFVWLARLMGHTGATPSDAIPGAARRHLDD